MAITSWPKPENIITYNEPEENVDADTSYKSEIHTSPMDRFDGSGDDESSQDNASTYVESDKNNASVIGM